MKISVCGKGGSGKSILVALLANEARARGFRVLVVDSDESNTGLFRMLGFQQPPVPFMELLGGKEGLKEKMRQPNVLAEEQLGIQDIPPPYKITRDGLTLVSIGKILQALEGCACPMGVLSREFLRKLRLKEGEMVFVDMEAGVEHFGRGVSASLDGILLVVEPSLESITLAGRVKSLASGMEKKVWAVLNKITSNALASKLKEELRKRNIVVAGAIPYDPEIFEACLEGRALGRGEAAVQVGEILDLLLQEWGREGNL